MFKSKKNITEENKPDDIISTQDKLFLDEDIEHAKIHEEFSKTINKDKESLEDVLKRTGNALFTEIEEYYEDETITDIEWDGDNLWITQIGRGCYKVDKKLSKEYTENLAARLDRKSTRLNSSHDRQSRMPSSA